MLVTIKCLTDGARIDGKSLRASQVIEMDCDDAQAMALKIAISAGDFALLDGSLDAPKFSRAKASE